ncbi:hypothetical protein Glove_756g24 [Diversispora epigaea]|uniref:Protein kinase domain-containing protein n=1 Tax=Diversispora epigaea TaxID=1348612 RepID=A0A397G3H1_9GLOM|nr:hypothetical protein Glove_756g24 [Diversispora epigaea]
MSQKEIKYCPEGHSTADFAYSHLKNSIRSGGICDLCTKKHFIQEFKTWSSGNANIDKIMKESQINNIYCKLQWIHYDDLKEIQHLADGIHGSVYSAKLENGIKRSWNFIKKDWKYNSVGKKVALKEIKDSRYDIVEFLKVIKTVNNSDFIAKYYGISKNPSTQNYIIVMESFDDDLHKFLTKNFWDLKWQTKIDILLSITKGLRILHAKNLVHCNLHSGNILKYSGISEVYLDLCKLENGNNKNNKIYGSIPYIPPEVLRGNKFTMEGVIYSFGGIMYELITAQQPFADQAHDTYLMIDICNGVRPKVPDFMLNWIPEWYLDLMYRCWSDDPSKRPTSTELSDLFYDVALSLYGYIMHNNVMQQLEIADENQKNTSKSQKQELFELSPYSSKSHPQSCYISRHIYTFHGLRCLLEEIKSGKSSGIFFDNFI